MAELLTPTEVAALLRVSRANVYRLVDAGQLAGVRLGRTLRIPAAARSTNHNGEPRDA